MGSGFDFDLEIRMGSGAFVCGEETALMTSIEGHRGEPRPRPPFPAVKGLWGKPSVLNNVETFANIAPIILKGAEWYASTGTEKSKGTKVFALGGNVQHTGLVEVPIGMQLGELIYEIGGGIPGGKAFKAAQLGGPSGGCIPKQHLNVPVDYESLQELGAIMGSGGLIVMDEDTCMVDIARFFLDFIQDESCGKCPPCRVGTKRMLEIVTRICDGEGEEGDIERLDGAGRDDQADRALRPRPDGAQPGALAPSATSATSTRPTSRTTTARPASARSLFKARCSNACPASVNIPGFVSLVGEKRYDEALKLHRERNPLASICARVCFHPCESKCSAPASTTRSPSATSSASWSSRRRPRSCPRSLRERRERRPARSPSSAPAPPASRAAYFLARLGYKPVVFEAEPKAGGMLVQAIPAYRLPRDELEREVQHDRRHGRRRFEYGKALGRDFTLQSLKDQGYEAVFVGVGAPQGTKIGIPGEDGEGVVRRPLVPQAVQRQRHRAPWARRSP